MVNVYKGAEKDVEIIHSTYSDNPFLPKDYVESLENLIHEDINYYRIYALGQWGKLEGKIYSNYEVIPELPNMSDSKWAYGLDFGLVNPTALIKVYMYKDHFYLEQRIYRAGLTNKDIIEKLTHEERGDIYCDPSAKMMTEEIRQAGFAAIEGHKGVKEGIDLCQRQKLYIPQSSTDLIKEIQSYAWKKDPNGPGFIAEPVKFNDHGVDAVRYAIWGLTERWGYATKRPGMAPAPIKTLHFTGGKR